MAQIMAQIMAQVMADAFEVTVLRGAPRGARQVRGATVVALDERGDESHEGCNHENVHGRNSALEMILPRVAGLPMSVEFLP
jgi:hypothetical protein